MLFQVSKAPRKAPKDRTPFLLEEVGGPVSATSTEDHPEGSSETDHTYAVASSPKALKKKLDDVLDHNEQLKKKLKVSNQKVRRMHDKI